jgi:hypothetical protein
MLWPAQFRIVLNYDGQAGYPRFFQITIGFRDIRTTSRTHRFGGRLSNGMPENERLSHSTGYRRTIAEDNADTSAGR